MMKYNNIHNLPLEELEQIGLYHSGELQINTEVMQDLLQGKRTQLLMLKLKNGNNPINLPAKLSFINGEFKIHPVYKQPQHHPLLGSDEASLLIQGQRKVIHKKAHQQLQEHSAVVVEYDRQTNEFISYSQKAIPVIRAVNNIVLNDKQKESLAKGEAIAFQDGTRIEYTVQSLLSIHSDKKEVSVTIERNDESQVYMITLPEPKASIEISHVHQEQRTSRMLCL